MLQVRDHWLLEPRVEVEQQPLSNHVYYLDEKILLSIDRSEGKERRLPGTVNIALSA